MTPARNVSVDPKSLTWLFFSFVCWGTGTMEESFIRAIATRTFACFEQTFNVVVSDWHPSVDHLANAYYLANDVGSLYFRNSLLVDSVKNVGTDAETFTSIFS